MTVPAGWEKNVPLPHTSALDNPPREILVIKPSSLGDIVHTLPGVALLRQAFPQARIRWLVNTEWAPLLAGNPHIDEVIEFPRRDFRGVRGAMRIGPWARRLRERAGADLILDYQGLLRSALVAKLCRGEKTRVIGLSDAREGARYFYDEAVDVAGLDHAVDRYLALTTFVTGHGEIPSAPPPHPQPSFSGAPFHFHLPMSFPLPQGEAPPGFEPATRYIVLHPFSRGAGKSLSAEQIGEFCHALHGNPIVIVGRSETVLPEFEGVVNLLNKTTLPQLIWFLRLARYVVSVDSGPMHIAAALTPRLVSIHTWSDPRKVGPYEPEAWVWRNGALSQMKDLASPERQKPAATITDVALHVAQQLGA